MDHSEHTPEEPEICRDERYDYAVATHSVDSWVYIHTTKQFGIVEEVRPSPNGPRIKVKNIGSVPLSELRPATEEEIRDYLESKK